MELENTVFGEVKADPDFSDDSDKFSEFYKGSYLWVEKQVGFYPLFLAVGETEKDIRMTGYQNQFGRLLIESSKGNTYRKKGEFPNNVLFSFEEVEGVFTDFDNWFIALDSEYRDYKLTDYEKRLIFKPSWEKSRWLRKAKMDPHSVQLVVPSLDLRQSKKIWVRNKKTKKSLEDLSFRNVEIKRLKVDSW